MTRQEPSAGPEAGARWADGVGRGVAETDTRSASVTSAIDTTVAHPARRYDYWLGGKTHYAADRASGDAVAAAFPSIRVSVLENRRFLRRTVTCLADQFGIRQFLDIGTGIPSPNNTHEVAQRVDPHARVLYVDNDPVVLVHARALLRGTDTGMTAFAFADLREPEAILGSDDLRRTLDLSRPVALMMLSVLQFLHDADHPRTVVAQLMDALPSGSCLVLSHPTYDFMPADSAAGLTSMNGPVHGPFRARDHAEFARFFEGLELVPPGIVPINEWRPDGEPEPRPRSEQASMYGAVARKP